MKRIYELKNRSEIKFKETVRKYKIRVKRHGEQNNNVLS